MTLPKPKKGYNGYLLTDHARAELLEAVPPMFADVVAHHVTHDFGVYETLPPDTQSVQVVANCNNDFIQAVIVKVMGTSTRELGNSLYHITISMDKAAGASAVDSNAMVQDSRNGTMVEPFDLSVTPTFFPFGG